MTNETIEDAATSRSTRSPRRSRPPGSAAAPRSRSSRRRSAMDAARARSARGRHAARARGRGRRHRLRGGRHVGERGRLITSDFSPAMLDAARRRGAELGLGNVDYRVIDAERIELDDDSVDGVLCRFGYMLMADPAAAFAETRRVLRPGGRVALAVWGALERNPFFAIARISLVQRGHIPPPEPPAPAAFSMASAERTDGAPRGRRVRRGADRGGRGAIRDSGRRRVPGPDRRHRRPARAGAPRLADSERAAVKADVEDVAPALRGRARLRAAGRRAVRGGELSAGGM